jgi:hypothetical protein
MILILTKFFTIFLQIQFLPYLIFTYFELYDSYNSFTVTLQFNLHERTQLITSRSQVVKESCFVCNNLRYEYFFNYGLATLFQ